MMGSSLSSNITEERRNAPYYSKYEYRIVFKLQGAHRTYWCDNITDLDNRMLQWGETYADNNSDREELAQFIVWKNNNYDRRSKTNTLIITLDYDSVRIYTNNIDITKEIQQLGHTVEVTKAIVEIPVGVKEFSREPKHKFRTYFKAKRSNDELRQSISDFLVQYQDIHPCGALVKWLKMPPSRWPTRWVSGSFFVDYDNEGMKSVLMLILGNQYIGKHYELRKRSMINTL